MEISKDGYWYTNKYPLVDSTAAIRFDGEN
jgi:hypothetical protein